MADTGFLNNPDGMANYLANSVQENLNEKLIEYNLNVPDDAPRGILKKTYMLGYFDAIACFAKVFTDIDEFSKLCEEMKDGKLKSSDKKDGDDA